MQNNRGLICDFRGLYRGLNTQNSIDGLAERPESMVGAKSNVGGKVEAQLPIGAKLEADAGVKHLKYILWKAALNAEIVRCGVGHE